MFVPHPPRIGGNSSPTKDLTNPVICKRVYWNLYAPGAQLQVQIGASWLTCSSTMLPHLVLAALRAVRIPVRARMSEADGLALGIEIDDDKREQHRGQSHRVAFDPRDPGSPPEERPERPDRPGAP